MNFFENQDQARRSTRWLVIVFILAVLAIVAVIDLAILAAFGFASVELQQDGSWFSAISASENIPLLAGGAIATTTVIGLASLFKTMALRGGGGKVARDLGGTLVSADTSDRRRRQLRNVVEEIALASGVPVPEIYVLEEESGINAFAAGYTPADAAVAVTRGALEKLKRDELQGVIAHEFSHILNGDMRINIRLMGALFGILVLALIGRRVLIHSRFASAGRSKDGAPLILIALAVTAVGYIGLFFGRWIKAAVSRQREYLADASAVQFTRDPNGIGGALKKIAVYSDGSYLREDSEEISHMLFGNGSKMMMFSTHPPLTERIKRIEPGFQEEELETIAARIMRDQVREEKERKSNSEEKKKPAGFDLRNIMEGIGHPDFERILMAATLAAGLPVPVREAAHSPEWAPEVMFYTLLHDDAEIRERQLLAIAQNMGSESESQVRALLSSSGPAKPEQRLPVAELAFPALKRRPPDFLAKVLTTVEALSRADEQIDVFEFLLARVIARDLWESANPHAARIAGNKSLAALRDDALSVLAILARHGTENAETVRSAYQAGVSVIGGESGELERTVPGDWAAVLDKALPRLDKLKAKDKKVLVEAMLAVVLHDEQLQPTELELLRVVCELIHVPLPILSAGQ
ncbi:MAG TPA: M48 family metallopeptidase [Xanthomonadales bacterium]|nr:M48 family metallopeptidase [Xanthomonadales bacterium]